MKRRRFRLLEVENIDPHPGMFFQKAFKVEQTQGRREIVHAEGDPVIDAGKDHAARVGRVD